MVKFRGCQLAEGCPLAAPSKATVVTPTGWAQNKSRQRHHTTLFATALWQQSRRRRFQTPSCLHTTAHNAETANTSRCPPLPPGETKKGAAHGAGSAALPRWPRCQIISRYFIRDAGHLRRPPLMMQYNHVATTPRSRACSGQTTIPPSDSREPAVPSSSRPVDARYVRGPPFRLWHPRDTNLETSTFLSVPSVPLLRYTGT